MPPFGANAPLSPGGGKIKEVIYVLYLIAIEINKPKLCDFIVGATLAVALNICKTGRASLIPAKSCLPNDYNDYFPGVQ